MPPRASVAKLYLPRITEERRLRFAEETTQTAEHGLSDYTNIEDKEFNSFLTRLIKERLKQI